jgi:hypothetical protein
MLDLSKDRKKAHSRNFIHLFRWLLQPWVFPYLEVCANMRWLHMVVNDGMLDCKTPVPKWHLMWINVKYVHPILLVYIVKLVWVFYYKDIIEYACFCEHCISIESLDLSVCFILCNFHLDISLLVILRSSIYDLVESVGPANASMHV